MRHADGLPFVHVPVKHTDRRSVCQIIEEDTPAMRLNIRGKAGRRRPVRRRVQVQYKPLSLLSMAKTA
ncbi:resolvase [Bifidobacterium bifidum]|nr:resolvase [Bifidobacterium bifidum]PVV32427.1 resolvase [Bifidobacterium bifidum]PVV34055.1 resolvase [Bifidobacterium bifidum]PVV37764.1 resolvase [Bifidobacterium bifidum]PVV38136.1 resolvase [Bifidobacterium bifidum]